MDDEWLSHESTNSQSSSSFMMMKSHMNAAVYLTKLMIPHMSYKVDRGNCSLTS